MDKLELDARCQQGTRGSGAILAQDKKFVANTAVSFVMHLSGLPLTDIFSKVYGIVSITSNLI